MEKLLLLWGRVPQVLLLVANQQPEPIYVSCGHQKNIDFTKEKQWLLPTGGFGAKKNKQKVMECCSKIALEQKIIKIERRKSNDSIVRNRLLLLLRVSDLSILLR